MSKEAAPHESNHQLEKAENRRVCQCAHRYIYMYSVHNAPKAIRLAFLRKVFGLLITQLILTFAVVATFTLNEQVKILLHSFLKKYPATVLILSSINLFILITLCFYRKRTPINFILLIIFTIIDAVALGFIALYFSETVTIVKALILTGIVVTILTVFTFQSKRDFSAYYTALFAVLVIFFIGGFFIAAVKSEVLDTIYSVVGALLFCLYIIIDLQIIMKKISPEEYIFATISLYMDILNVFVYILRIFASNR